MGGERSGLFFEIARLVGELRPRFVFLENVSAITVRGAERVVGELCRLRYDCRWGILSASDVGANHRRERWWLLAYSKHGRMEKRRGNERAGIDGAGCPRIRRPITSSFKEQAQKMVVQGRRVAITTRQSEPGVLGMVNGLSEIGWTKVEEWAMGRPRKSEPKKSCATCGKEMERKSFNGRLEDLSVFKRRKYCSLSCANTRQEVGYHGNSWRARQHLKDSCERCGKTKKLHAHHADGNRSNNTSQNIQTLCGSCHNWWHHEANRRGLSVAGKCPC